MASDLHLRLLSALALAEAMAAQGRKPHWALACAASTYGVDRLRLACLWLDKRVGCDNARAKLVGIAESELIEQPPARNPRPRVVRRVERPAGETVRPSTFSQDRNAHDPKS